MCGQDGFLSNKGHILWAWVLLLSRKNLFFETLHWWRVLSVETDSNLTVVRHYGFYGSNILEKVGSRLIGR